MDYVQGFFITTGIAVFTIGTFIYIAPKIANSQFIKEIPEDMQEIKNLAMSYVRDSLSKEKK